MVCVGERPGLGGIPHRHLHDEVRLLDLQNERYVDAAIADSCRRQTEQAFVRDGRVSS